MNGKIYVYFNKKKYEQDGIKKYYVGQTTKTMTHRAGKNGANYLFTDTAFARAIKKWGWDAFECTILVDNIQTKEELDELEKYYIQQYDSFKNGYNCTLGGDGLYNPSEETRRKMSEAKKGKHPHNYGKKMSDDFRKKCSQAKKGVSQPKTRKRVYCKELNMTFDSVTLAGQYLHENLGLGKNIRTQIGMACNGKVQSCGKIVKEDGTIIMLTWCYVND